MDTDDPYRPPAVPVEPGYSTPPESEWTHRFEDPGIGTVGLILGEGKLTICVPGHGRVVHVPKDRHFELLEVGPRGVAIKDRLPVLPITPPAEITDEILVWRGELSRQWLRYDSAQARFGDWVIPAALVGSLFQRVVSFRGGLVLLDPIPTMILALALPIHVALWVLKARVPRRRWYLVQIAVLLACVITVLVSGRRIPIYDTVIAVLGSLFVLAGLCRLWHYRTVSRMYASAAARSRRGAGSK